MNKMAVTRYYVEKRPSYAASVGTLEELHSYLGLTGVTALRVLVRYDIEGVSGDLLARARDTVFCDPSVDILTEGSYERKPSDTVFSVEYLPGQFDQRADSAVQCLMLLGASEPMIRTATTYVLSGSISGEDLDRVKEYFINPVDSREAAEAIPMTLAVHYPAPSKVETLDGFTAMDTVALKHLYDSLGLAMTYADFEFVQDYFADTEHRDPTITEIRVLDTYWSDHCRHTTFLTKLSDVEVLPGPFHAMLETSYERYLEVRRKLYGEDSSRPVCLMDLALIAAKKLKRDGVLTDLEESEENNACTIVVPDVESHRISCAACGGCEGTSYKQDWLVFFKNETHNHPTEIEPFGGAATCLGGAIRDPLSGRGYVYQAMRVTGAADPRQPIEATIPGKLPQKKLVRGAASGYSSYGNQIGLATGLVREIYHPGYVAKRLEIGAVMGAAPRGAVVRKSPVPGDVVILLGGRTGRDGCGGATGSSKSHNTASINTCAAEVQKGNPPTERKIQRLFRNPDAAALIKKCNDFGAGGVSVAIGELADGLDINLDLVLKKYEGLDGTELAISESQERMAVVVAPEDADSFLRLAEAENLEAVCVATVTESPRLVLSWQGQQIVNISREFLDTNGARQISGAVLASPDKEDCYLDRIAAQGVEDALKRGDTVGAYTALMSDLGVCSEEGLIEMFDSSIGAASVLMPLGGRYQRTPSQVMCAKLPDVDADTDIASMMSYGFDPYLSSWSPYHGAAYAVTESVARIVAAGGDPRGIHFTFQEFFGHTNLDPARFGPPMEALLGAFDAQLGLGLAAVGGKDSMSGTFNDIDVPPTLVSFAVDMTAAGDVLSPELKRPGDRLVLFRIPIDDNRVPDYRQVMELYRGIHELANSHEIAAAYAVDSYGTLAAVARMAFGNMLGVSLDPGFTDLYRGGIGNILAEVRDIDRINIPYELVGEVVDNRKLGSVPLDTLWNAYTAPLEGVFPTREGISRKESCPDSHPGLYRCDSVHVRTGERCKPTVFIPIFPGTNCEYDSARAFERAGARVNTLVFKNLDVADIEESACAFERAIDEAQILMFPGGFSAGDEPDGSAKFFAAAFRNDRIKAAVSRLLDERDGLALGICNGFQALMKLGLVPYGRITDPDASAPTLTYNTIHRHISTMAYTKVVSNLSPWLAGAGLGETYVTPASHGEGRFVAPKGLIDELFAHGQVATRYADPDGVIDEAGPYNINGSYASIEGITSPDGRVYGKMAHAERRGSHVAVNIYGEQDLRIFKSGVGYFS